MPKFKADIEEARINIRNCRDLKTTLTVDGYEVAEWHPELNGEGKPTQVHIVLSISELQCDLAIRFKSRASIEKMIASLTRHALNVWPDEFQQ